MKVIVSTQNKEICAIAKLHTSKGRQTQNKFIAEGFRTFKTLVEAKSLRLTQVYVTQPWAEKVKEVVQTGYITLVSDQAMEKMSMAETASGIVAVFEMPSKPNLANLTSGIVLAQISDPGNMGTLIRTTAAMGYKSVVVIEGCDPWSPKVIQATAGTIANIQVFKLTWQELVDNKKDLQLAALVVSGGLAPDKLGKDSLIVVGNEAHGLPEEWLKDCGQKITLKMPGQTESLNAAVAGSIAMYLAQSN